MSYRAPGGSDHSKDVSFPSKDPKFFARTINSRFQSPLLQTSSTFVKTERGADSNYYNNSNSSLHNSNYNNRPQYSSPVRGRIGPWISTHSNELSLNNDRSGNNNRNFNNFNNRKRSREPSNGPVPRKQWKGKRPTFHNNSNNQHINTAQSRLNSIRSNNHLNRINPDNTKFVEPSYRSPEPEIDNVDESQDLDATDITVQVINPNAQPKDEATISRFKMILDPQTQASIRSIQQKKKEKQVIFPFPVTPNVTEISLHERFGML